jgi:L-ascorbate metabolism protein UlaG (beta-lactamase superfamily)
MKRPGRRTFLVGGTALGVAGVWTAMAPSWAGGFLRDRFNEIGREIPDAPGKPTPHAWQDNAVTMAWIGHATVLINMYGVRIITDPTLFRRIGVDLGLGTLGPLRLVNAALTAKELPEIDLVLVSHAHFDHLDTPSLGALPGNPAVIMASKTSDLLPRRPYASVRELRWEESTVVKTRRGDVHVRAIEVKHWGARVRRDTYRGWTGFVLEREGSRLLIGGDTALTPLFAGYRRFGPFDAAVMPVGAYDPWIWNHCSPEQAVQMADAAGARLLVPVHHRSFRLSNEGFDEPIERIQEALRREPERIAVKNIGDTAVLKA